MSKILSISVSNEDKVYLDNDKLLSPSKIFQVALHNIKENRENLKERIKQLEILLKRYGDFVFECELKEKFNIWSQKNI